MTMNSDSALEAFAHCCSKQELVEFLDKLPESGRERLKACGHLALPLALEFNKDSSRVLEILLKSTHEIQVNLPDQDGNTVLHLAVLLQDEDAVRLLLKRADLNPNVRDRHGDTPLHVAVAKASGPDSPILDRLRSDSRVNIFAVTTQKRTALHVACMSTHPHVNVVRKVFSSASSLAKISFLQFLQSPDESGRTALHYAAENGRHEIVEEILSGSRINSNVDIGQLVRAGDARGCLAVHLAAQNRHLPVVNCLLQHSKDQNGLPLLRCAVKSGRNDIMKLCLKDLTVSPTEYLELLSLTTHLNIADLLLAELHEVLGKDYARIMEWAVKDATTGALVIPHFLKWHPDHANKKILDVDKKQTALHIATISGNSEAVKALCGGGAPWDLHANKRDVHGLTALDYAFRKGDKKVQRILMARQDVREYIAQLHNNRALYTKASNAILVVAVLIATLTYAKCSTKAEKDQKLKAGGLAPSPSATTGQDFLEYVTMPTRLAFFLAIMSCLLAAFAALPFSFGLFFKQTTDDNYVRRSLYKTRVLLITASYCLVLSLGAVLFGFICSQYISPFIAFRCATACKAALIVIVCLSLLLLASNAVTAFHWPTRKIRSPRFIGRTGVGQVPSVIHHRRAENALDKKQSKKLLQRAAEELVDDVESRTSKLAPEITDA